MDIRRFERFEFTGLVDIKRVDRWLDCFILDSPVFDLG